MHMILVLGGLFAAGTIARLVFTHPDVTAFLNRHPKVKSALFFAVVIVVLALMGGEAP